MPNPVETVYLESSQYKRWTISIGQLAARRKSANENVTAIIRANIEEEASLSGKPGKVPDFPSWEEELLIVNYYAAKVYDTGGVFGLPSHLKATAAAYIRRFYLTKSAMQYHPKNIMITSLFLATKTCEHHVDLDTFVAKLPKQTKESVLEHEFLISSTIQFDFMHWSAYRPLYGFVLDMQSTTDVNKDNEDARKARLSQTNKLHDSAKSLINACIWSDLPFLFMPSQLALAAMYHADPNMTTDYLARKGLSGLLSSIKEISTNMADVSQSKFNNPEMMAKVKAADKKLFYSRDPAMKLDSALYKKRNEIVEHEEQVKRQKKGEAAREAQETFGAVLS